MSFAEIYWIVLAVSALIVEMLICRNLSKVENSIMLNNVKLARNLRMYDKLQNEVEYLKAQKQSMEITIAHLIDDVQALKELSEDDRK